MGKAELQPNYEALANEVVYRACKEYKHLYKKKFILEIDDRIFCKKYENIKDKLNTLEKFFYSQYFHVFTSTEPNYILKKIKAIVEDDVKMAIRRNRKYLGEQIVKILKEEEEDVA